MSLLEIKALTKYFGKFRGVDGISFNQAAGEKIALAGETGSGKTTLLRMIGGLEQASDGSILFDNNLVKGPLEQLIPGHKGISYLSQHFELRNNYRVEDILSYADKLAEGRADQVYHVCKIEQLLKRRTDQLSGGERQRVALAKILISSPRLLLLDEPFSNLDRVHKQTIKEVIRNVGEELGITCILVSHDSVDLLSWADRILVLQNGKLIQEASPLDIYLKPVNEYCAGLFGDYNLLDVGKEQRLFARPELLDFFEHSSAALYPATVIRSYFNGSYYMIELNDGKQSIWVQRNRPVRAGATVSISLARAGNWYL